MFHVSLKNTFHINKFRKINVAYSFCVNTTDLRYGIDDIYLEMGKLKI